MNDVRRLKKLVAIAERKPLKRSPVPPPPRIAWLRLEELVIDAAYQRGLSEASDRLIRRLVENWDWSLFKPLSVAATGDGRYEVIDGQHTAIAAITHGAVETLPCLVLTCVTQGEKAAAFVGINTERTSLSSYAIYRAKVISGDPVAMAVDAGVTAAGGATVEKAQPLSKYPPGVTAAIATLLQIARRGGKARIARLLKIAIAGGVGPVPAGLLRGLEAVTTSAAPPSDERLAEMIRYVGIAPLTRAVEDLRREQSTLNLVQAWSQILRFRAGAAPVAQGA